MTLPVDFARKLNLPPIPEEFFPDFSDKDWKNDKDCFVTPIENGITLYSLWTEEQNRELNEWCQQNICDSTYFAFTISNGQPIHKDSRLSDYSGQGLALTSRLVYTIKTGGENVKTCYWADDKKTLLKEYVLEPKKWYYLATATYHSVTPLFNDNYRVLVTAQMLHQPL